MSIWIAGGFNHAYLAKAEPWLESLRRHEPDRAVAFTVDFHPGQDLRLRRQFIEWSRCLDVTRFMLQSGAFTVDHPADWSPTDVVVFTDTDGVIQRPLDAEEQASLIEHTRDNGVMIGRNKNDPQQTLADEALALFPKLPLAEIDRRLPNLGLMLCRNTGCIAARLATWKRLYEGVKQVWPDVAASFNHYARCQLAISFVVQRDQQFKLHDLPLTFHAHAHHGMPPEVSFATDGSAWVNGKRIWFRHVI